MAYELHYRGESHHHLSLIGQMLVKDDEWHVEVTTKGGERKIEGPLVGASGPVPLTTAGSLTVQPWDYDTYKPVGEPVTIDVDDIEELVIP